MPENPTVLCAALASVSAYRNILRLPVMQTLIQMFQALRQQDGEGALTAYSEAYYQLHEARAPSLCAYLNEHLHYDSAPYPELAAHRDEDADLTAAARRDVGIFARIAALTGADYCAMLSECLPQSWREVLADLPQWPVPENIFTFEELTRFYQSNGAGLFSKYRAFLWRDGALHPVAHPDFTPASALVGYHVQRDQVYSNTAALVSGKRVNNVLLYGESGTGKSATVKSLLGEPSFDSLRLIELEKSELAGIPDLIRILGHRPQKFILYIDDLAFDKDDQTYSLLKTILEGGLEPKPANVAIYATSNRRHLVRETFSDRTGDEVDANETISEKTSLSERFGLRIPYLALNQDQFLTLCFELAEKSGITLPQGQIRAAAIRWSMRHPGRTPRVAQQFIHSLLAQQEG